MMTTTHSPYADTYDAYWRHGWRGILPLPPNTKWPPPTGYTGYQGDTPSYPDCATWADTQPHANIALRLPPDTIGLDVDAYDNKPGAHTLANLVAQHGPLPPTILSSSRGDGISGIRLYRVPPGTRLITALPGIELIQHHHRYVVAPPSQHPQGGTYTWTDETTGETGAIPHHQQIPPLPDTWITALTETNQPTTKTQLNDTQVSQLLTQLPPGPPCRHILAAAGKALAGTDRHDAYNAATLTVLTKGHDGCPGAYPTLQRLRAAFIAEISDRATPTQAAQEWARSLRGAAEIVATRPLGPGACPDTLTDHLITEGLIPPQPSNPDDQADDDTIDLTDTARAYQDAVNKKTTELKILSDARQQLATLDLTTAPPLTDTTLTTFLTQPDDPIHYRVDQLWPAHGRVLLVAAAKTGKTTIVGRNLLPALVDGGKFLGQYDTPPTPRRVIYLNLEVSEQTLRAWMRTTGITNTDQVVIANLRGKANALQLHTPQGRQRLATWLRDHDADTVILDPLAPVLATLGLEEDSNSDVARFFAWWSETLTDAGVTSDLICHHAGHAGQRSRGASRLLDEPDAIWTVTRQQGTDPGDEDDLLPTNDHRFITAYGRDVDLPESALNYDPTTGRLTLMNVSARQLRRQTSESHYEQVVLNNIQGFLNDGIDTISKRMIRAKGGNQTQLEQALDRLVACGKVLREDLGNGRGGRYFLASQGGVGPVGPRWGQPSAPPGGAAPYRGTTGHHPETSDTTNGTGPTP